MDTVQAYVAANIPEEAVTPEHAEELEACVFYSGRHLQIDKIYLSIDSSPFQVGAMVLEGYITPDGVWADYEAHDYDQAAEDAVHIARDIFLPR